MSVCSKHSHYHRNHTTSTNISLTHALIQFYVTIDLLVEMADTDQLTITVPHVMQKFHWDCGLACSQMVLRFGHQS